MNAEPQSTPPTSWQHQSPLRSLLILFFFMFATQHAKAQYTESFQSWSATSAATWQTKSLAGAPFNVPANAVVEVAVQNSRQVAERSGGVRAVGSSLERRLLLMESETSGNTVLIMHVQTDSSSQIQHYAEDTGDITFVLIGYWTSGTYVERFDTFAAGPSQSWTDETLCSYGVRPGHVAEFVMTNVDGLPTLLTRSAGVRTKGSVLERRLSLTAAEGGGVQPGTMFVKADSSQGATVQVYAEEDDDVDFYLVGYWSTAPRAYTETFTNIGSPSASATWEDKDLTASGLPDSAIAEFALANEDQGGPHNVGVRANGSSLARLYNLHKAQGGSGGNHGRMNVAGDSGAVIEFNFGDITKTHKFYMTGYWTSCDSTISYVVSDLGAITSSKSSLGLHINSSETVAGFEEDSSGNPSAWIKDCDTFTSLGTLGGSYAEAHGINNANRLVGWSNTAAGRRRAFSWTSGGGMTDLGVVSGRLDSEAQAVNASSEVVGTVADFARPPNDRLAFIYLPLAAYSLSAGMNSLGTLGGTQSVAMDINDSGQVTGGAQNAGGNYRPFRWASGTMTDLGTLGGDSTQLDHRGEAVNSSGRIAGRSYTAAGAPRAFFWNGTTMTNLGVLTGGSQSWAFGANDSDVVVGTSDITGGSFRAFVWDSTNGMRNLNNLISAGSGWTLIRATDINNEGYIVGWGTNGSGNTRAFLLTPSCSAGGGGAAAAEQVIVASGTGATDASGIFDRVVSDSDGETVAVIEVVSSEQGASIHYEVAEPVAETQQNGPGGLTLDGFAEGKGLRRLLKVEAATDDALLTVTLQFAFEEINELGASASELEMHLFDASAGRWIPAGTDIGESQPTGNLGESGHVTYADGLIDYWSVTDTGGQFAVGKPLSDELAPPSRPVPRGCGPAMIPLLLLTSIFLSRPHKSPTSYHSH